MRDDRSPKNGETRMRDEKSKKSEEGKEEIADR